MTMWIYVEEYFKGDERRFAGGWEEILKFWNRKFILAWREFVNYDNYIYMCRCAEASTEWKECPVRSAGSHSVTYAKLMQICSETARCWEKYLQKNYRETGVEA